jgi:uncharacterized protein (DUF2141 family)
MHRHVLTLISLALSVPASAVDLNIHIAGVRSETGRLYVGLYKSAATFPKADRQDYGCIVTVASKQPPCVVQNVPAGKYAIAIYQDMNDNGVLDKNLFGKPKEPYGFSNNASGRLGPPSYDDAAVVITDAAHGITVSLRQP